MGEVAFTVPILPGKKAALEDLGRVLRGPKANEVAEMLRRHGGTKETWFLQSGPQGDLCIVYWEAEVPSKPMEVFTASRHPFDMWLKAELQKISGVDLNHPAPMEFPRQVFRSGY